MQRYEEISEMCKKKYFFFIFSYFCNIKNIVLLS